MSVSLVVLRLEIAEEVNTPDILRYRADEFNIEESSEDPIPRQTYAAVTCGSPAATALPAGTADSCRFRGRREYREIVIETHHTEEIPMDEASPGLEDQAGKRDDTKDEVKDNRQLDDEETKTNTASNAAPAEEAASAHPKLEGAIPKQEGTASPKVDRTVKEHPKKTWRLREMAADSYSSVLAGRGERRSTSPLSEGEPIERPASSGKSAVRGQSPLVAPTTMHFFSGNPCVERTEGIIHLYKDNHMTSLTDDVSRSEMICILSVPANMTSQDLLQFIAPVEPWIENIKIIRDGTPNMYMVLIKFHSQKHADEFYTSFNNQPFNSIEPETCHLVYVAQVETVKSSEGGSFPVSGLTELPCCPVCLERMDESVDGILTILCNHSFHSSCLSKWGDTSCPVCRYVQTPELVEDHICFECNSQESLWICLVCGHVGCGRYVGGHAYSHFQETHHTYSMQLGNNRVWDYAGDNYVHRLVQNKGDGKLVQVDEGGNVMQDEKLDSITLEYTYLLTSQLESQRHYFEEKIEHIEKEAFKQVEDVELRSKKALEECSQLHQNLVTVSKDKQASEKKCQQMHSRLSKLCTDLKDEKEMNKCLLANQSQWQDRVTNLEEQLKVKDKEMLDLQEQLRDVMFYLEAQQKLANTTVVSQQEIQEGQVILGATGGAAGAKKSRKKGR